MNDRTKKPRANSVVSTRIWQGKLHFAVLGAGEVIFDLDKWSMENRSRAMYHGAEQRGRDAAALLRNTDTGKSASPQDKLNAIQRLADHYNSGTTEWNIKVAAGTRNDSGLIIQASMRVLKLSLEGLELRIGEMMDKHSLAREDVLKNLGANPSVIRAMADIKAERASDSPLAKDLLAEMMEPMSEADDEDEDADDDQDEAGEEAPF
jgi:hypothetical protein